MKPNRYLTAAALLVSACMAGWSAAQTLTSQPIEPVLASPITLSGITATGATLEVTTTIDLACVVVYGTDQTFGLLALDQNMGGSAHQDHVVVMRGLEPDTEYVYRLQGSDPNGTFYASDIMSFRTPSARERTDLGENIAMLEHGARVVEVSSEFSSSFRADNALDGRPESEWSSRGDGNDAFLTVELPEVVEVAGFGLWTRTMGSSAEIHAFEVENEAGDIYGPFEVPDASGLYSFEADGRGQRFTFRVVDSSGGNTGIVELAVFVREN